MTNSSRGRRPIDIGGMRYGSWTVGEHLGGGLWGCRCDCGTERALQSYALRRGLTSSCGCMRPQARGSQSSDPQAKRLYTIWTRVRVRYIRGIDEAWLNSFAAFREDVGPSFAAGLMIEPKDPLKPLGPDNFAWTRAQAGRRPARVMTPNGPMRRKDAEILWGDEARAFPRLP